MNVPRSWHTTSVSNDDFLPRLVILETGSATQTNHRQLNLMSSNKGVSLFLLAAEIKAGHTKVCLVNKAPNEISQMSPHLIRDLRVDLVWGMHPRAQTQLPMLRCAVPLSLS